MEHSVFEMSPYAVRDSFFDGEDERDKEFLLTNYWTWDENDQELNENVKDEFNPNTISVTGHESFMRWSKK